MVQQTWKRYDVIVNPEWHHVSLATLANIDNDMLDEKKGGSIQNQKKRSVIKNHADIK